MLAPIYICPKCGETWHIVQHEEVDCDRDEIYQFMICSICFSEVTPKITEQGHQVWHILTEEEMEEEMNTPLSIEEL